jgi:hypothetical protein
MVTPDVPTESHEAVIAEMYAILGLTHAITAVLYFPCICRGLRRTMYQYLFVSTFRKFPIHLNALILPETAMHLSASELCYTLRP